MATCSILFEAIRGAFLCCAQPCKGDGYAGSAVFQVWHHCKAAWHLQGGNNRRRVHGSGQPCQRPAQSHRAYFKIRFGCTLLWRSPKCSSHYVLCALWQCIMKCTCVLFMGFNCYKQASFHWRNTSAILLCTWSFPLRMWYDCLRRYLINFSWADPIIHSTAWCIIYWSPSPPILILS